jgi:flagellar basal-body rod protein FlgB
MRIVPSQFDQLAAMLHVASQKHKVTAQNIANVNTPGYHRLEVAYDTNHLDQLSTPGATPFSALHLSVSENMTNPERVDGNNVDIDAELSDLGDISQMHSAFSQILQSRISAMRSAITGR